MKSLFLLPALLLGAAPAALAQSAIPAGTISLGGSIGYSRNSAEQAYTGNGNTQSLTNAESEFRLTPSVGYFVADDLAIGLDLQYRAIGQSTKYKGANTPSNPTDPDPATELRVGPYVQRYKMLTDQFGILGTLGAGYYHAREEDFSNSGNSTETKAKGFYTSLTPGIIYFPVPRFGISASMGNLGYTQATLETSNMPSNTTFTISSLEANFGLDQLNFGGTYFFGR